MEVELIMRTNLWTLFLVRWHGVDKPSGLAGLLVVAARSSASCSPPVTSASKGFPLLEHPELG